MTWKSDKQWSDKFLPEIKSILGQQLISSAPIEDDAERNTDLIVLRLEPVRIACRIRKYEYALRYPNEFTIRAGRPSGAKTELAKVIEGWGDYFFYGFSNEDETELCAWSLCNLKAFRLWFNRELVANKGKMPGQHKDNADNSSDFIVFSIDSLPPEFIVARKTYSVQ